MYNKLPKNLYPGLKQKLALNAFRLYRKNTTKLHELQVLFWECTLRCSLNCVHCGSDCHKESNVKDMPLNDFLNVLNQVKKITNPHKTMIAITGGEPLMRSDLEKCGLEIYKREFPWGIVTNGWLLNEKRLQSLLNSGLRSITISIDGLKDSHDWFRGRIGSFDKALHAAKLVSKLNDIEYDVVTCAHKRSINELEQIKKLLIDNNINNWRIFTVFPTGRAKQNHELQLNNNEFKFLFDFIEKTRNENKLNVNYGCEGFLGSYEGRVRDNFFFCRAGISIASVLADGSISACPSLRSSFNQGNIYHDNFIDVWENRFDIMRNRNWTKKGICKNCKFYKWCEGNALHLYNNKNHDLEFCHLYRMT